ncbi:HPt (histidine-containing phosphotransfer) domain-containing protein [Fluviicoccus keumensis]|uniref:HPt (Histidine-containing phosphotransfer) domain-containing protein n=1 Tax=Fluviicoccus keumensis TaxID=1435465 RepID=A0A4Q7ZCC9_9GAMM|nr:Hpt domain-containing protein [Fluviicoccus keumensis]RZU47625.1 HPt (histidine-containing phosphotransfer) domain-containing protein [Fluviicoccus keumensis]
MQDDKKKAGADEVLDIMVLTSIGGNSGLASPLVKRLLALFRQEASKLVHGIEYALTTEDQEALLRQSHTLKSSSASIGAQRLSQVARHIEQFARQSELAEVGALTGDLRMEFARLLVALDAIESQLATVSTDQH